MMSGEIRSIVILTGAGVSAESGLNTFRASDGLWENHPVEQVATPEGFAANPELVYRFYNERRSKVKQVEPNRAHKALAELEKAFAGDFLLVTQNVDNLHERAGSQNLVHMHGEIMQARCQVCGDVMSWLDELNSFSCCGVCGAVGQLRPHIVWFGEMPLEMERIERALSQCDLFVAIGTSGNVYPAAGFVLQAAAAGARTVELNLEPSAVKSCFDLQYYGAASEVVPAFFKFWLG